MKFFESDLVKQELNRMQDLYLEINKMGLMLTAPQKKEQLSKMIELINLQQTMYMRVTLSDDPDAKQMVDDGVSPAEMVQDGVTTLELFDAGVSPRDMIDQVQKMVW